MAETEPTGMFSFLVRPSGPEPAPSPQTLDARRKMALAIMARRAQPYPKNVGEGIAALGEGIGDRMQLDRMDRAERAYDEALQKSITGGMPLPGTTAPTPAATVAPVRTSSLGPITSGPRPTTAAPLVVTPSPMSPVDTAASTADLGVPAVYNNSVPTTENTADVGANDPNRNALATAVIRQQDPSFQTASTEPGSTPDETPAPMPQPGERIPAPPPRPRIDRTQANAEVQANPELASRIATIARGEVGNDPRAQQVIAETIANRAAARGQTLDQVMQQYTGPGSRGYYPASTFGRGQASPDVVNAMLRGSDVGGQALGFAPTGNASGGVAARGIASGRYNEAGRLGPETFVQQASWVERPERLEGARQVAALGGGIPRPDTAPNVIPAASSTAALRPPATVADATDNPPIVRSDIKPMPGPLTPPTPEPPIQTFGRTPQAPYRTFDYPVAPRMNETPTKEEIYGMELMRRHPGDPNYQALAAPYIAYGQAQRKAEYDQQVKQFELNKAEYERQQTYERSRPETDVKQATAEIELANKQRARTEQARFGTLGPEKTMANLVKSYGDHQSLPDAMDAIATAKRLVGEGPGMFTGILSEAEYNAARLKAAAGGPVDPRIATTEAFKATTARMLGGLRSNVAGPGSQSNAELQALLQAAGGDIKLSKEAIQNILNNLETASVNAARKHQEGLLTAMGSDPNDQRMLRPLGLPMERILPQAYVDVFKQQYEANPELAKRQIDEKFHTPGLGQAIIDSGR